MSAMPVWALAGIGCAALLLLAALLAALLWRRRPRYRRQAILTANEREFHRRLLAALPECELWPQVPLLAMLRPDGREGSRGFWRGFRAISNARVDWVVVRDGEVVAVVELDDRSHVPERDRWRDRLLDSCGYRVVRFESARRPSPAQIRDRVLDGA